MYICVHTYTREVLICSAFGNRAARVTRTSWSPLFLQEATNLCFSWWDIISAVTNIVLTRVIFTPGSVIVHHLTGIQ
jgi:hypothetical protein